MKKKILITLILLLTLTSSFSQTIQTQSTPNRATRYLGGLQADSTFVVPIRNHDSIYPNLPYKGRLQLNSETNALEYNNGDEWVNMGGNSTGSGIFGVNDTISSQSRKIDMQMYDMFFKNIGEFTLEGKTGDFVAQNTPNCDSNQNGSSSNLIAFNINNASWPAIPNGYSRIYNHNGHKFACSDYILASLLIDGIEHQIVFKWYGVNNYIGCYLSPTISGIAIEYLGYREIELPEINLNVEPDLNDGRNVAFFDGNTLKKGPLTIAKDRFGIEDNISVQDRNVDFNNFDLNLNNIKTLNIKGKFQDAESSNIVVVQDGGIITNGAWAGVTLAYKNDFSQIQDAPISLRIFHNGQEDIFTFDGEYYMENIGYVYLMQGINYIEGNDFSYLGRMNYPEIYADLQHCDGCTDTFLALNTNSNPPQIISASKSTPNLNQVVQQGNTIDYLNLDWGFYSNGYLGKVELPDPEHYIYHKLEQNAWPGHTEFTIQNSISKISGENAGQDNANLFLYAHDDSGERTAGWNIESSGNFGGLGLSASYGNYSTDGILVSDSKFNKGLKYNDNYSEQWNDTITTYDINRYIPDIGKVKSLIIENSLGEGLSINGQSPNENGEVEITTVLNNPMVYSVNGNILFDTKGNDMTPTLSQIASKGSQATASSWTFMSGLQDTYMARMDIQPGNIQYNIQSNQPGQTNGAMSSFMDYEANNYYAKNGLRASNSHPSEFYTRNMGITEVNADENSASARIGTLKRTGLESDYGKITELSINNINGAIFYDNIFKAGLKYGEDYSDFWEESGDDSNDYIPNIKYVKDLISANNSSEELTHSSDGYTHCIKVNNGSLTDNVTFMTPTQFVGGGTFILPTYFNGTTVSQTGEIDITYEQILLASNEDRTYWHNGQIIERYEAAQEPSQQKDFIMYQEIDSSTSVVDTLAGIRFDGRIYGKNALDPADYTPLNQVEDKIQSALTSNISKVTQTTEDNITFAPGDFTAYFNHYSYTNNLGASWFLPDPANCVGKTVSVVSKAAGQIKWYGIIWAAGDAVSQYSVTDSVTLFSDGIHWIVQTDR